MNVKLTVVIAFMLLVTTFSFAQRPTQEPAEGNSGTISGTIVDEDTKTPLGYVNVVLKSVQDSTIVNGTLSNEKGKFTIVGVKPGKYYLSLLFIGYKDKIIDNIKISPDNLNINLKVIPVKQTPIEMEGVEVSTDRPVITYQIDKKVVDVSKQFSSASGTAIDVLENIPSVSVDADGNVSLRGSGNFTVLIDGRPTILDANDALKQIPASSIENIELITNPSAKFDPEGIAGIINVILKKQNRDGMSGMVNLNAGLNNKYGGDVLFSRRSGKFNTILGTEYNKRSFSGDMENERRTYYDSSTYYIKSNGSHENESSRIGLRAGIEYELTKNDLLSLSSRYGKFNMNGGSEFDYDEWSSTDEQHTLYISKGNSEHGGNYLSANLDHTHNFKQKGHTLISQASYSQRQMDDESVTELFDLNNIITEGDKSSESGPSKSLRIKSDYTFPMTDKRQIEAGLQIKMDREESNNENFKYDIITEEYVQDDLISHNAKYTDDIHAIYGLFSDEFGKFGYKAGMRGEYTYRIIDLVGENQTFKIDRFDYFPSLHLSYQVNDKHQFMTSYARRIDRPHGWDLEPFQTWMDAYNVRVGNPDLKPEYIDSYELGYNTNWGSNLFSIETYYRVTSNVIDRVQSVYDTNVTLHTVANIGSQYDMGAEVTLNLKLFDWWNINLMNYLYNSELALNSVIDSTNRSKFSWNVRFNNDFKLTKSTKLQFNLMYNSPRVTSQGTDKGSLMSNTALKQELFDKKLSLTLQVRDLFGSTSWESTSETSEFYSYQKFTRESPIVMLSMSYNINNFKQDRKNNQNQEENGSNEESEYQ
jgi:outer membrane receptor protein involved in Fe transport